MVGHGVAPAFLHFGEKGDDGLCQSEVPHGRLWGVWSVKVMAPWFMTLGQPQDSTILRFTYSVRWAQLWKHQLRSHGDVEGKT